MSRLKEAEDPLDDLANEILEELRGVIEAYVPTDKAPSDNVAKSAAQALVKALSNVIWMHGTAVEDHQIEAFFYKQIAVANARLLRELTDQ